MTIPSFTKGEALSASELNTALADAVTTVAQTANTFTEPQTFAGIINQSVSAGANNESPFAQYGDFLTDFIVDGLSVPVPSPASLTATLSTGTAVVLGQRTVVGSIPNATNTYAASSDTYVSLSQSGAVAYAAVANGATAPAPASGAINILRVVTGPIISPRPFLTSTTGGSLAAGTYNVALVAHDATGYGTTGEELPITVAANSAIVIDWFEPDNCTGIDVYVTPEGGTSLGIVASEVSGTSYTYTGSVAPTGTPPVTATSNAIQYINPLVNQATKSKLPVTPQTFGAVGDGVADDTTALLDFFSALTNIPHQNNLYLEGEIPPGTYCFSETLKISPFFGSLHGKSPFNTFLKYIGSATDIDLVLIEGLPAGSIGGAFTFGGLSIISETVMTAGAAVHFSMVGFCYTDNINISPEYLGINNCYNGVFYDKTDFQTLGNFYIEAINDGILVAGTGVGNHSPQYDLYVGLGKVTSCGHAGIHIGGGWDGANFDSMTVVGNGVNVLIDNAIYGKPNQEILFGPLFYTNASSTGANYHIDDPLANPDIYSQILINGEITGAKTDGINIVNWPSYITINSPYIVYNTGNGVLIEDSSAIVSISPSTNITDNGQYGISASSSMSINGGGLVQNNTSGNTNNVYDATNTLDFEVVHFSETSYTPSLVAKHTFLYSGVGNNTVALPTGIFSGQRVSVFGAGGTLTVTGSLGLYNGQGANTLTFNNFGGGAVFEGIYNSGVWQIIPHASIYRTESGTTSGYIEFTMTTNGMGNKFTAYANGYENDTTTSQTISFPFPFLGVPVLIANTSGLSLSVSTTELTITAPDNTTTYSGLIIVEGF